MVVDGEAIVAREYWDPITKKLVEVDMKVKDHIYIKHLRDIADRLMVNK